MSDERVEQIEGLSDEGLKWLRVDMAADRFDLHGALTIRRLVARIDAEADARKEWKAEREVLQGALRECRDRLQDVNACSRHAACGWCQGPIFATVTAATAVLGDEDGLDEGRTE